MINKKTMVLHATVKYVGKGSRQPPTAFNTLPEFGPYLPN